MATWDDMLDMDPEGLSDLGLLSDTASGVAGDPGEALGGRTNLEDLLLRMGDPQADLERLLQQAPSRGQAARDVIGNPMGALTSAALIGLLGAFGGSEGAVAGVEGVNDMITERLESENARHKAAIEAGELAVERRLKLASGMQQLLMQRPDVLAGEDPQVIGELAFPGAGLYINPAATLQNKQGNEQMKLQIDTLKAMLSQATGPAKTAIAMTMFNLVPGLRGALPRDIFDTFARQDGDFTDQQLLEKFGATGMQAAIERRDTGRLPYEILKPIANPDQEKLTEIELKQMLLEPVQAFINDQYAKGEKVNLDQAIDLALDETDAAVLRDMMPELRRNEAAYLRTYLSTVGQAQMFALMNNDLMTSDPVKFKQNLDVAVQSAMEAASRLERQNLDIDYGMRVEQVVQAIQSRPGALQMPLSEAITMARKVVDAEFRESGRGSDIPSPGAGQSTPGSRAETAAKRLEELRAQQRERSKQQGR